MSKVNNSAVQRNFFRNDKNAGIIQFPRFVYPQEELHKYILCPLKLIASSEVLECIALNQQ